MGVEIDKDMKKKTTRIWRLGDRLIVIKLVLEEDKIYIFNAYTPRRIRFKCRETMRR